MPGMAGSPHNREPHPPLKRVPFQNRFSQNRFARRGTAAKQHAAAVPLLGYGEHRSRRWRHPAKTFASGFELRAKQTADSGFPTMESRRNSRSVSSPRSKRNKFRRVARHLPSIGPDGAAQITARPAFMVHWRNQIFPPAPFLIGARKAGTLFLTGQTPN